MEMASVNDEHGGENKCERGINSADLSRRDLRSNRRAIQRFALFSSRQSFYLASATRERQGAKTQLTRASLHLLFSRMIAT